MADLKEVTDPTLTQQLDQTQGQQPPQQEVTDPNLASQLEHQAGQQRSQQAVGRLGPTLSSAVRPIVEGATAIPAMVGDMAVGGAAMGIDLAKSAVGMDPQHRTPWGVLMSPARGLGSVELPSKNVQQVLDHYTTPPATGFGSFAEFVNSMLAGGILNVPARALSALATGMGGAANDTERLAALRQAHDQGYRIPPSEFPRNALLKGAESISGSARVVREMSHSNQETTNRLAKLALGLHPEHPPLTEDVLEAIRLEEGQAYDAIRNMGPQATPARAASLSVADAAAGNRLVTLPTHQLDAGWQRAGNHIGPGGQGGIIEGGAPSSGRVLLRDIRPQLRAAQAAIDDAQRERLLAGALGHQDRIQQARAGVDAAQQHLADLRGENGVEAQRAALSRTDYTPPEGGSQGGVSRYDRSRRQFEQGSTTDAPSVTIDRSGRVHFVDGRHRTAAMRDLGDSHITVAMDSESIANARGAGLGIQDSSPIIRMDDQLTQDITHAGSQFSKLDRAFPGEPAVGPQGAMEPDMSLIERSKGRWLQPQFTAGEALDAMIYLRAQAKTNLKVYDPTKNALGMVQRQIADAFEARLMRHAQELGQPQLVQRLQDARVRIAQTYAVENALNLGTGNVSARKLGQQYAAGAPLTGQLQDIAESALTFPRALQDADKIPREGPFSVVDFLVGAGGWLDRPSLALAVLTRPALRMSLNSRAVQGMAMRNATREPSGVGQRIPGALTGAYGAAAEDENQGQQP